MLNELTWSGRSNVSNELDAWERFERFRGNPSRNGCDAGEGAVLRRLLHNPNPEIVVTVCSRRQGVGHPQMAMAFGWIWSSTGGARLHRVYRREAKSGC
jgi:hypothetical protein